PDLRAPARRGRREVEPVLGRGCGARAARRYTGATRRRRWRRAAGRARQSRLRGQGKEDPMVRSDGVVDESREIAVRRPLRVRRFRVARSAASGAVRTVWGLVLLCALGSLVSAQDPVRVRGTGDDESAAIKSALIEAVQRVSGVQVYTDTISEEEFREIVRTISEKFDASLSSTQNVRLASRGFVRSYAVVDRGQDADGRVFVEIEAVVARPGEYRADGIMTMTI